MPKTIKNLIHNSNYKTWLADIKNRVRSAQLKAAVKVNTTLLELYWELGADIMEKQVNSKWGAGLIEQLSRDLSTEFPDIKGFSRSNLMHIQKWYLFYTQDKPIVQQPVRLIAKQPVSQLKSLKGQQAVGLIVQQPVAQITRIPWGHNIAILYKCKAMDEALFYVQNTIAHNWSRSVLVHQIESGLYKRSGKAVTNFFATLPAPQSDLAHQMIKDPYTFDFMPAASGYREKDLEQGLLDHIQKFLVELGVGFAFVGRQVPFEIGGKDFYLDLLFYHLRLRCYVVIELKAGEFKPEFAGKLNFYLSAVDDLMRHPDDKPSIGLILCKSKERVIAEYALRDISKPIGIANWRTKLVASLPADLKGQLPTIKEIEAELGRENNKSRKA